MTRGDRKFNQLSFDAAQVNYMCGNSVFCYKDLIAMAKQDPEYDLIGFPQGRDLAMRNIRENYILVGIIEQWDDVLEMLEYLFPSIFAVPGEQTLTEVYRAHAEEIREKYKTVGKPPTEQWVKDELRHILKYEYEVYEYAKMIFNEKLAYYRAFYGKK